VSWGRPATGHARDQNPLRRRIRQLATPGSAARLPFDTARLAGRFVVPLTAWFAAGEIVRYLLMQAISHVALGDRLQLRQILAMLLISLVVLTTLLVVVGMLCCVSGGLSSMSGHHIDGRTVVLAACRAIPVFVVIYLAWNLFVDDLREVLQVDAARHTVAGTINQGGRVIGELDMRLAAAIAVASWILRVLVARRHSRTNGPVSGLLVAFFEISFTLYGALSLLRLLRATTDWFAQRIIWVEASETLGDIGQKIPGWTGLNQAVVDLAPHVTDGVFLPMVWFAIAAVVYGVGLRGEAIVRETPLARIPELAPGRWSFVLDEVTSGLRDKYVPLLQMVPLALRGSGVTFATFCLCYVACGWLAERAQRGVAFLIGPDHTVAFWNLVLVPMEFGSGLLFEVLRIAVLAAMVDLVLRRLGAHRGTLTDRTAAADRPAPPAVESRSRTTV
jgi:hypothetical protein